MVQSVMKAQKVEITHRTIIFTVLFLISLLVLWQLRALILTVFLCFLFMEGLHPIVNWLEKTKMPRALAIFIVYLFIIAILSFSVVGVIPDLVEQSTILIKNLPTALKNIDILGLNFVDFSSQLKILENLPENITSLVVAIFSNVLSIFIFFVITFYLLLERKNFDKYLKNIFGQKSLKAINVFNQLEKRLSMWVGAQLMLMLIIGILSYFGYVIIGVNFALPLAIIAAILELVPNIGPTIASILAGIFGLTISPITGVLAVIWGIIVQQLENNFIVPKIMKEATGINPLITILLIASGARLGGVVGAIIALPLYITVETIYRALNTDKN
ncbi:MAG TPA: AI-2E family transporter [Candidatus Woesebacteria bacterium]|nr:AI-2E family transporter [Candidatus Woesebacteria bacterium]HPR99291.1 AI-2E family transporter [Candidatus Woesebacteria bacterium]